MIGHLGLHRRPTSRWQRFLASARIRLVSPDPQACLPYIPLYPHLRPFQCSNLSHQYRVNNTIQNFALSNTLSYFQLCTFQLPYIFWIPHYPRLYSCITIGNHIADHGSCQSIIYLAAFPPSGSTTRVTVHHLWLCSFHKDHTSQTNRSKALW